MKTKSSFREKMQVVRENKAAIYKQMEEQANDPETIAFYNNPENTFEDVDRDILFESSQT